MQRASFGFSTNSSQFTFKKETYYISESVGQNSPIGSFFTNKSGVRQGFQQPPLLRVIANETNTLLNVTIFPNPIKKDLHVVFNEKINSSIKIKIINSEGKLLYKSLRKDKHKIIIDLTFLATGVYHFTIMADNKKNTYKLIKT
jgi:hypothetical protein